MEERTVGGMIILDSPHDLEAFWVAVKELYFHDHNREM